MNTNPSFVVQGLAQKRLLKGTITIGGAKNAALKAMAACILFGEPVKLYNIPKNRDVGTMVSILEKLGAKIAWKKEGELPSPIKEVLEIDCSGISSTDIDPKLAVSMRSSVVLTGPLLARFGRVSFPAPGGCVIGARPIDLFIDAYKKLGATVELRDGLYIIEAKNGLGGGEIFFNIQTVGGTETLMMASIFAKGKVTLRNCAMEPEIVNVAKWLLSCGAKIYDVGSTTIEIEGNGGKLLSPKADYTAIPDRIETGSFLVLSAMCASDVVIKKCNPSHLESLTQVLQQSGVNMEIKQGEYDGSIRIFGNTNVDGSNKQYSSFNIRTHEYPGFSTDMQSPIVTFLTQSQGESIVLETIYEGRLKFTEELQKMGADITILNSREILIRGPKSLTDGGNGASLYSHDIRGGFAVLVATICGTGKFTIQNVQLIDRGYEDLENRLKAIGVNIERV